LAAEPEARAGWKRPSPGALLALAGTIVGLISGIAGLIFLFNPDLQPSGEADEQAATLSNLRVRPNLSFRDFLAHEDFPSTGYTPKKLAERGAMLQFRVSITGFEGRALVLKWELFDAAAGHQVAESLDRSIKPTTRTNTANQRFFVPLPQKAGSYYAVVELLEQKKTHLLPLDTLETDPFPGLAQAPA
jgi:hypothetical protein